MSSNNKFTGAVMETEIECPLGCEMNIRSDATVNRFCTICGMIAENGSRTLGIGKKIYSFCCDICLKDFRRMRINLKRAY